MIKLATIKWNMLWMGIKIIIGGWIFVSPKKKSRHTHIGRRAEIIRSSEDVKCRVTVHRTGHPLARVEEPLGPRPHAGRLPFMNLHQYISQHTHIEWLALFTVYFSHIWSTDVSSES
jgi:hypothetical protein